MENKESLLVPQPENPSTGYLRRHWIKTLSIVALCVYLTFVVCTFCFYRDQYSGDETHPVVDAFYFSIVTMTTVGYGDIVPLTKMTKIISIGFVLISIVFLDLIVNYVVDHFLKLQEHAILALVATRNRAIRDQIVEEDGGKMKMIWKLGLVVCVVVFCVGIGACVLCFVEELGFLDSVYLSVMSVTTVGYGDEAFSTVLGRCFAAVWLVFSTIAMASLFYYFTEMRVDRKVVELPMSESEFIVYQLRESGKISEDDIKRVVSEYEKLDRNNLPKITVPTQVLAGE